MIIPLVGPPYAMRHRTQSSRELINLYLVSNPSDEEYAYVAYPTPGATVFAETAGLVCRGMYEWRGLGYTVIDNKFYEVTPAGVMTQRGTLSTSFGTVSFASIEGASGGELCMVDGVVGYSYLLATQDFAIISDADFPNGCETITATDERFIVPVPNTSNWQISEVADGRSWDALDIASKRSRDDKLMSPVYNNLYVWLFGEESAEAWINTGNSDFTFERQPGLALSFGLVAKHSAVSAGNQLFWLGRTSGGSPLIYASNGFQPSVISTENINYLLANNTVDDCVAYSLTMEGHEWVVFNFPTANFTYVYDLTTSGWFELQSYNTLTQTYGAYFANCHMLLGGQHIVGDRSSGNLYKLDFDTYTEKGLHIRRRLTSDHMDFDQRIVRASGLQLKVEAGIGLQEGQGSNPQLWLEISKDHGYTWSSPIWRSAGAVGEYSNRMLWSMIGTSRKFTFRFTMTDPVPWVIYGARVDVKVTKA